MTVEFRRAIAYVVFALTIQASASAAPVVNTHPRLLLSTAEKNRLLAKKNANDASWLALKAQADLLATYPVAQYKFATSDAARENTIFYTYQGEGWLYATLPLAFAYQMTQDTKYSNKLIELAQEMIRAQSDPENNPPRGQPPIQLDSYYASRNVAPVLAFIYDFCYDQLSSSLKTQIVTLMNAYYDDVSVNGYQAQEYSSAADGNYFGGHLFGVGLMGYASFGDNPRAQEMIEWARIRFDGSPAPSLPASKKPEAWRTQTFEGGMRPAAALDYNGPPVTGAPFKSGFDFQAWSYGSEEFGRMIDYMLIVKSATGEDLIAPYIHWFSQILRAEKHALFPNRFMIDPTGDWGGFQGAVISKGLPTQLAFLLSGTQDGPGAQHFLNSGIAEPNVPGVQVFAAPEWLNFYYGDTSRPAAELTLPPYYSAFAPNYPKGGRSPENTNGAVPYFLMRSDWSDSAVWASVMMGSQWWGDHQHYMAGHMVIARGGDYLLVSAADWKVDVDGDGNPIRGASGVLGDSSQLLQSALNNTLYFDDFGDFQGLDDRANGGQGPMGIDEVVANESNQNFTYVRSDLTTAYHRSGDPDDTPNRTLDLFYRNFLYLREANVFVVYDQARAKTSNNRRGPYQKHLRWHLPNTPTITGTMARLDYGQSRLYIDTVLPANAGLKVVDEWRNPDPCTGSDPACEPFEANAGTFRIEVRDPQNSLFTAFLTVLQPGSSASAAPTNTAVTSLDSKMSGVSITTAAGSRGIVLFNAQEGQTPAPVTETSYRVAGTGTVTHTLMGMVPGARYSVVLTNGVVQVTQSANGDKTASAAGVLHFVQ